ncbi:MAG: aspartate aminotransferase family protein [Alphaproteobacteria bacterium]|nr:aspartate aminotransferase family protein [Alphaproteobacteria bacterium]
MNEQPIRPNSLEARDIATIVHPYTNLKVHESEGPLVVTRGEGVRVWDHEGKDYIEGMAGLWCTALGFGEERLVEAAAAEMRKLPFYHHFTHKSHDVGIDLAERLLGMAPVPMSKVFFANSGSEANDTAAKLVWYLNNAEDRPERKKIISRIKAYHGVTIASASLTGLPKNHEDFDLPIAGILHTDCPHYYRFAEAGESEEDFATRCAESLRTMIEDEGPETVAAFIAEPIMGAGGVVVPPKTYFQKIQAVLKEYEILFIVDEVITGFGRTGNMWGSQTFDLNPDIITMAKALTSAYLPMSAVMISDPVYRTLVKESEKVGVFAHGFTYSGHPVPSAVALETLKIYEERDIVAQVRRVMGRFQERLKGFAEHDLVGEARGTGLIGAVELVQDKKTKASFSPPGKVGAMCAKFAQSHGLITRAIMDSMAFSPPLIITVDEIDDMFDRFALALNDTADWVAREGLTG